MAKFCLLGAEVALLIQYDSNKQQIATINNAETKSIKCL